MAGFANAQMINIGTAISVAAGVTNITTAINVAAGVINTSTAITVAARVINITMAISVVARVINTSTAFSVAAGVINIGTTNTGTVAAVTGSTSMVKGAALTKECHQVYREALLNTDHKSSDIVMGLVACTASLEN
ncbi:hypothetical protein MKX08_002840 [Trichoderma sp. CBMAI-0020]|nr:hypothetical protein MKX08_002840 [Trichoderma sp. CBMAI-0020]